MTWRRSEGVYQRTTAFRKPHCSAVYIAQGPLRAGSDGFAPAVSRMARRIAACRLRALIARLRRRSISPTQQFEIGDHSPELTFAKVVPLRCRFPKTGHWWHRAASSGTPRSAVRTDQSLAVSAVSPARSVSGGQQHLSSYPIVALQSYKR